MYMRGLTWTDIATGVLPHLPDVRRRLEDNLPNNTKLFSYTRRLRAEDFARGGEGTRILTVAFLTPLTV